MFGNIVVRTKFIPPVQKTTFFSRKNLTNLFQKISQYPVTLLQAGPGYGKSTSLASYFQGREEVFWYSVGRGDGDVLTFLLHLIYAFNTINPQIGEKTLNYIREKGENNQSWLTVVNSLINELWDNYRLKEMYLIIDDYHLLAEQRTQINELVEHLVEHRPPNLHLIISTRITPDFPSLAVWRVKDHVLEIGEENLRLTQEEIRQFFVSQYNFNLTNDEAGIIYNHTEGWIIALEMIWQGLKQGGTLQKIKNQPMTSLEHLFRYLAQEVLAKQKPEIRDFLIKTSLLRVMTADSCNYVREAENSEEILRYLVENGLFTFQLNYGQYRYHHLFHDFLKGKAREELTNLDVLHKEVAEFFMRKNDFEEAIYHGMEGGDYYTAARILAKNAPQLLQSGRFSIFIQWFNCLPERIRESFPHLYLYNGDISRFTCNFKEALDWYNEGRQIFKNKKDNIGLSLAFQKIAMIYLDTVQPAKADKYLKKALALREKENNWEEITLIRLIAENLLNLGQLEEARKMQDKIHQLSEENTSYILDSRVKIRTGRLPEAEQILEKALIEEGDNREQIGRAHRETYLLRSLIAVFKGEAEKALRFAHLGLEQAEKLGSEFTRAVAYMRLGHAYQISGRGDLGRAILAYEEALRIVDQLDVRRGRAEALWGLTLVYGHMGREAQMKSYGMEGLNICEEAGDEWLATLIKLSMGIGYVALKDNKNAARWFTEAVKSFDYCNDVFGKTMGQIWLTLLDCREGAIEDFKQRLAEVVPAIQEYGFAFIFKNISLHGQRDLTTFVPILTEGYNMHVGTDFCKMLLEDLGIEPGISHPGYTLRIQTLGKFRVLRDQEEIESSEWKRAKARTLFQLFLTHQNTLLPKEQLAELLSPEKDEESAFRDFKVALNALNNALEPSREARATPFFITKRGSRYGLNTASSYEIDSNQFERLVKSGLNHVKQGRMLEAIEDLSDGLKLYQGSYLPDAIYEDWSRDERERLKNLFLHGAETLANLYYQTEQYQPAVQICEQLLTEETCHEEGYQLMMKALAKQGKRSRAVQVYKKCFEILQKELGVQPTQKTIQLFDQIKNATHL